MRRSAKLDDNQQDVVKALRGAGNRVLSLASVGDGCPDLLVSTPMGTLVLLEVKDGRKPPSARKLTDKQWSFHQMWSRAPLFVVTNATEALAAVRDL